MRTLQKEVTMIRAFLLAFLKRLLYKYSLMTSQAGQDYWVFGEAFNEKRCGYFLDIGAHDGMSLSNTFLLESRYNWSGICIEANPVTFEKLKKNRRAVCLNCCLDRSEGHVDFVLRGALGGIVGQDADNTESNARNNTVIKLKTSSLCRLLEDQKAPHIIDYVSVDIEGSEERVLAGFDFNKYTFRCITIERPTGLLRDLFKKHDYILIKEIPGLDCFYVHRSFLQDYTNNLFNFYKKKHLSIRWR